MTSVALANIIRIATIGDSGENVAKFNAGEQQVPIIVRVSENVRNNLFLMQGHRVPSTKGGSVPLGVVADVVLSTGPSMIVRYERKFRTVVEADIAPGGLLGPSNTAALSVPMVLNMPEGTSIQSAGDAEIMGEIFTSFALAMGAGIFAGLRRAGLVVLKFRNACYDPFIPAAVNCGRDICALCDGLCHRLVGGDRLLDVDGHCHQKRHHVGRIRT